MIAVCLLVASTIAALAIPYFYLGNPAIAPGNGNSGNGGKTRQDKRQEPLPELPSLPPSLPDSAKPLAQPGKN